MSIALLDNRIAYGALCTWWDDIRQVGKTSDGLPCCPHCSGVLFEKENHGQWFDGVDRYEKNGHPGYRKMVEWARGKCFKNIDAVKTAYEAREDKE